MSTPIETTPYREAYSTYDTWRHWPVNWSSIVVGVLSTIGCLLLIGLIGAAVGAHQMDGERLTELRSLKFMTLAFSVGGAFLASVLGGWVAGKIAGILRSEPAMLHGAIVWLATIPVILALTAMGAGNYFGSWHAGLGSTAAMPYQPPLPAGPLTTQSELQQIRAEEMQYREDVRRWREDTPRAVRNTALTAVTALLLGLVGSVVGGWMASGEPMTFTFHLQRTATARSPAV